MRTRRTSFLSVVLMSVLLAACSSAGATPTAVPPTAVPTAAPTAAPTATPTAAPIATPVPPTAAPTATPVPPTAAPTDTPAPATAAAVSGDITVLTQRTDLDQSGRLAQYAAEFNKVYPNVKVTFESITDYEGQVRIRMNTDAYGDVLAIPNSVTKSELSTFFEPLGTVADLGQKYRFINEQAFNGTVYGIATTGNAQGLVYNKKVFAAAGITTLPKTTDEFLADMKLIKDKTDAIPLYTNYKDGWPTTQWQGNRGSITDNPNFDSMEAHDAAPWSAGKDQYVIDKLMYDVVNQGYVEADPTTTAWEPSKALIGTGKIATMMLGSWAVVQMQAAAVAAGGSADDIGYMPFPNQVNGTFYSTSGGDYKNGVNIHSKNKAAAEAWVFWYADKSGFAANEGGIPPLIGGDFPSQLSDFATLGVKFVEQLPAPAGQESLTLDISKDSEIGLWDPTFPQRIIDAARGSTSETLDAIFTDLNTRWAASKTKLGG